MAFLEELVKVTKEALDAGYYDLNLKVYYPKKKLSDALRSNKISIISEIKFASPSLGKIRDYTDPVKIAKEMEEAGATALSVLTHKSFNGSLNYLLNIRIAVDLPLLMKDIIIDKRQIDAASKVGADCILLIYTIFKEGYADNIEGFIDYAHERNLEVLLEVHDRDEFEEALDMNADIIGINNRDLKTMKIDISNTERLLDNIKNNKLIISESGINKPEDIKRLYRLGIKGFLIGTSIMKSNNIKEKLYELMRAV
ncbi:MAG: indole-3-glycerol-phosphate synthase [Candidatus Nitrosocaldaceae archaeon]|nr:MAG: indole-3-glycerol-phosphate synthase [Candidatus Nitrosocaldaceae archaeon]